MSDYISREEAKARISQFYSTHATMVLPALHHVIDDILSADVRENIHGEWIDGRCSKCGCDIQERVFDFNYRYQTSISINFCPNCGADMRGEK